LSTAFVFWLIIKQSEPIGTYHDSLLVYAASLSFVMCIISATFSTIYYREFQTKTTTFHNVFRFYHESAAVPSNATVSALHTGLLSLVITKWISVLLPLFIPGMGLGICFFLGSAVFLLLFSGICINASFGFYLLLSDAWGNSLAIFGMDHATWVASICGLAVFLGFAAVLLLFGLRFRVAGALLSLPAVASMVLMLIALARQRKLTCWEDAKAHQHGSTIAHLCAEAIHVAAGECRAESLFRRCRDADDFLFAIRVTSGLFAVPSVIALVALGVYWIVKWRTRPPDEQEPR
jgi:hypothetical protein